MMECITISSSSEDEQEVQILAVKLAQSPVKVESCNEDSYSSSSFGDQIKSEKKTVAPLANGQVNDISRRKQDFLFNTSLVPTISLVDDCDEKDPLEVDRKDGSDKIPKKIETLKRASNSEVNHVNNNKNLLQKKRVALKPVEPKVQSRKLSESDSDIEQDVTKESNAVFVKQCDVKNPLEVDRKNGPKKIGTLKRASNSEVNHVNNNKNLLQKKRVPLKPVEPKVQSRKLSESESDLDIEQDVTTESNEIFVKQLIELCRMAEYGEEMNIVERKISNYYKTASPSKVESKEFKTFLQSCISRIENILSSSKDKFQISRIIKEFLNEMKNDPHVVDGKLRKLYSVYNKLVKRIVKLEEAEVESDEDGGNPYLYLDRYRKKAVEIYNKICELEGRSNDADRSTLQRFFFTGSTAPVPIQRAIERYYNKTFIFPDFHDVKKLVKKVDKEENLNLAEKEILHIAESVFKEIGERLTWRRKYDDYNILVDYLREDECTDPADFDMELQIKLDQNKKLRKKEQEVLDKFAMLQATTSRTEDKSEKNVENKLKPKENEEVITVNTEDDESSLSSSLELTNPEESDRDTIDGESSKLNGQETIIFSDSDEDLFIIENKKRKLDLPIPSSKCRKTDNGDIEHLTESCKSLKTADDISSSNNKTSATVESDIIEIDDIL